MSDKKKKQFEDLVISLKPLKGLDYSLYMKRIEVYASMSSGGDGGPFRETGFSIRELHYRNWSNYDFHLLLVELGESHKITRDQHEEMFPEEKSPGLFKKLWNFVRGING